MGEQKSEGFWSKLILTVLGSIVTVALGSLVWYFQNEAAKKEVLRTTKIDLVEKTTNCLIKANYLNEFRLRIMVYQAIKNQHLRDSLHIVNLTTQQTTNVQYALQKEYPIEYTKYMEILDYNPQIQSYLQSVGRYFSQDAKTKAVIYQNLINDPGMFQFIKDNLKSLSKIDDLDANRLVAMQDSILTKKSNELIDAMNSETKTK